MRLSQSSWCLIHLCRTEAASRTEAALDFWCSIPLRHHNFAHQPAGRVGHGEKWSIVHAGIGSWFFDAHHLIQLRLSDCVASQIVRLCSISDCPIVQHLKLLSLITCHVLFGFTVHVVLV